jgi:hypothetical protein
MVPGSPPTAACSPTVSWITSWGPAEVKSVRLHPNLAQVYCGKVERLHEALADPSLGAEALGILRGLIERVVIHPIEVGLEIELVGEIVRMVELGLDGKQAALPKEAASSVKVVAGARNTRYLLLFAANAIGIR